MIHNKYSWMADPGAVDVPEMPELLEDKNWTHDHAKDEVFFKQYTRLRGVADGNCTQSDDLCSCWFQGCHVDYGPHLA